MPNGSAIISANTRDFACTGPLTTKDGDVARDFTRLLPHTLLGVCVYASCGARALDEVGTRRTRLGAETMHKVGKLHSQRG